MVPESNNVAWAAGATTAISPLSATLAMYFLQSGLMPRPLGVPAAIVNRVAADGNRRNVAARRILLQAAAAVTKRGQCRLGRRAVMHGSAKTAAIDRRHFSLPREARGHLKQRAANLVITGLSLLLEELRRRGE